MIDKDFETQILQNDFSVVVRSPREENGPDGYPRDNAAFREAADRVLLKCQDGAKQAQQFLDKLNNNFINHEQEQINLLRARANLMRTEADRLDNEANEIEKQLQKSDCSSK